MQDLVQITNSQPTTWSQYPQLGLRLVVSILECLPGPQQDWS